MYIRTYFNPRIRRIRKRWEPGPWDREPDGARFFHAGFRCEVRRASLGNWCGYVLIPRGHPWHGSDEPDPYVHGGITLREHEPDGTWRIGFDCAHWLDFFPESTNKILRRYSFARRMRDFSVYRTMRFAIGETISLAEQAREAST